MRRPHPILWLLTALLSASAGVAQTSVVATPVAACPVQDAMLLPSLSSAFEAADAGRFAIAAADVVRTMRQCGQGAVEPAALASVDLRSDYLAMVWPAAGPSGDRGLAVAIVHAGAGLYERTLGGIGPRGPARLFQVFLSASARDRLKGVYISAPEAGPIEAHLPAFAAAIAAPLLAAVAPGRAAALRPADAAQPPAWLSIARVELPFRRASVQIELLARVALSRAEIARRVDAIRRRMVFADAAHSPCAVDLANGLAAALEELAVACAADPGGCADAASARFADHYQRQEAACRTATPSETTRNLQALQRVDAAFRALTLDLEPEPVAAVLRLRNAPRERFSLGVATAYVAPAHANAPRASLDRGMIVAEPPVRQVSLVLVNGAFRSYDAARPSPAWSERLRWFAGAVVAPEPGIAAGLSLLVVRGLAVNAGILTIATRTPAPGKSIGRAPLHAARPFATTMARGTMVGLSFNFR